MTAAEILHSYRRAAKPFKMLPSSWLKLILVASHGDAGCRAMVLIHYGGARNHRMLLRWEQLGFTESFFKPVHAGRPQRWLRITPKGLATLGITA